MKSYSTPRVTCSAVLLAAMAAASSASAQTVTKANNTNSLQFGTSYVGGVVPTASDTLIVDNTLTAAGTTANLGANVSVLGINFTAAPVSNVARAFTIGTGGGTLSIGSGGITKAANTSTFLIQSPIALTANQTWTINSVTGTGTGNFAIQSNITDGSGSFTANIGGTGRIDITPSGAIAFGNGVALNVATVVVNNSAAIVTLGNASQTDSFQIIKGRALGTTLGNFGVAGSYGDGGTSTTIILGGGTAGDHGFLEYTGASASSNRTFNFDRRTTGSELRNTNSASTLTLTGNIQNSQGTSASINSAYSFGGVGNITLTGTEQLKDNTDAGFSTTLNKNGTGTLTITGANANTSTTAGTFQGATNVNAGLLVVSGTGSINSTSGITVADGAGFIYDSSTALTKSVTLASGARFGGDGVINNISIGSGVRFVFDPLKTLDVTGSATFANSFGVDDLVNADGSSISWALINAGTYTLVANGGSFSNIENFGLGNAFDIGGGRLAYFHTGSLQLVVSAIPEPSSFAALAGLGAVASAGLRRRRRAA
ncbi:MAG: PEP-CTERM sorting domain-containing protein [Burkholderiales bacterium]|nr:PEP-CTERM sorting domain-containing protein [Opitutaceae bacterium]